MLIRMSDIGVAYGPRIVFDGFDLDLPSGRLVALIGPSGSGKSTLLAMLAGRLRPDHGHVQFPPELAPEGRPHPRSVSWIMQTANVFPRRRVMDNVAMAALIGRIGLESIEQRCAEALDRVGLADRANEPCLSLSGGEQQRVVVARALVAAAPILLADEPTASLDAANRDGLTEALRQAVRPDGFVVVATHDPVVAAASDEVIELTT